MNKVFIVGYVGKDPETRYLTNGTACSTVTVATSERWKDSNGDPAERTEWHTVEFFGKSAEVVQQYIHKGSRILVEGSIRYEEWTDKDGNKRNKTKIRSDKFEFLDSKDKGDPAPAKKAAPSRQASLPDDKGTFVPPDDDVPF